MFTGCQISVTVLSLIITSDPVAAQTEVIAAELQLLPGSIYRKMCADWWKTQRQPRIKQRREVLTSSKQDVLTAKPNAAGTSWVSDLAFIKVVLALFHYTLTALLGSTPLSLSHFLVIFHYSWVPQFFLNAARVMVGRLLRLFGSSGQLQTHPPAPCRWASVCVVWTLYCYRSDVGLCCCYFVIICCCNTESSVVFLKCLSIHPVLLHVILTHVHFHSVMNRSLSERSPKVKATVPSWMYYVKRYIGINVYLMINQRSEVTVFVCFWAQTAAGLIRGVIQLQ